MTILSDEEKAKIILEALSEGILNVDWHREKEYLDDIKRGLIKIHCIQYACDDVHEYNDCISDDE